MWNFVEAWDIKKTNLLNRKNADNICYSIEYCIMLQ